MSEILTDENKVAPAGEPVATMSSRISQILGLAPDADEQVVCGALIALQAEIEGAAATAKVIADKAGAQQTLDRYKAAGKVVPEMEEFWLNALTVNREATVIAMDNLVPILQSAAKASSPPAEADRPDKYRAFVEQVAEAHDMTADEWMAQEQQEQHEPE